jgi:NAD(P)-dependent dehydrogenase (short-subunit alcohol dehydrogenase family)
MPTALSRRPTVVVSGASAGVGRAVAQEFARQGWNVGLIARGEVGLAGTIRDVQRLGGRPIAFAADVADPVAVQEVADAVARTCGGIDVWVNNAMVTVYAPVQETSPEEFQRVTDVTYLGQVHGTMAALKHMVPADRGTIVHIGSALAYRSIPLQAAYCAAKAAVRGFVDSLRSELLHDGSRVRLTMVQLPAVNTPQFDWARSRLPRTLEPVPPIFQPEAIARHVYRAALDAPRELWIGGPAWKAILGNMLIPGVIDRYLARHGYNGEMTDMKAQANRPNNLYDPVDTDPGAHGRFDSRSSHHVAAADPRWLKFGIAAALGLAAGTMLFATEAHGREEARRRLRRE